MTATGDLFGHTKPRAKPRVMAHIVDAGSSAECQLGQFECKRCGWESGWVAFGTITEGKRGIPCAKCNDQE